MKKILMLGAALAVVSFDARAHYNPTDYYINQHQKQYMQSVVRPYLGADYVYTLSHFKKVDDGAGNRIEALKKPANGFAVSGGLKFHEMLSAEVSYQQGFKARKNVDGIKTENKLSVIGFDLIANTPQDSNFEFLGSLGVGYYRLKYTFDDGAKHSGRNSRIGVRMGLGGQYFVTDHIALRGMVRYNLVKMKGDRKDWQDLGALKRAIDFAVGTRIYF